MTFLKKNRESSVFTRTRILLLLFDAFAVNAGFLLATLIFYGSFHVSSALLGRAVPVTAAYLAIFWSLGLYRSLWRYAGAHELFRCGFAVAVGSLVSVSIDKIGNYFGIFSMKFFPASVYVNSMLIILMLIGVGRLSVGFLGRFSKKNRPTGAPKKPARVMIVGAGTTGMVMIKELESAGRAMGKPVVAVDDERAKQGNRIRGVPIRGGCDRIPELAEQFNVDEILLCIPSAPVERQIDIMKTAMLSGRRIKTSPALLDAAGERPLAEIRDIDINDLLTRPKTKPDGKGCQYLCGQTILVTGAGGSIGGEICRQAARYRPSRIVILENSENSAVETKRQLDFAFGGDPEIVIRMASVADGARVNEIFDEFRPGIVFHTSAQKSVGIAEDNPCEAVKVNVLGTRNLALAATRCSVKYFIMLSTFKAFSPTGVMGASKRAAEVVLQSFDAVSRSTRFSSVRFGNVLGTKGGVVPLFREQIGRGGPVTVTDPGVTRYFITIPEAAQLALLAGAASSGGEVFCVDMGEPISILTVAENMIKLAGLMPYRDIEIKYTGLRPGEPLTEALPDAAARGAAAAAAKGERIFRLDIPAPERGALDKALDELFNADSSGVREALRRIVPDYTF